MVEEVSVEAPLFWTDRDGLLVPMIGFCVGMRSSA